MTDHSSPSDGPDSSGQRLESWKDIASYLKRDVSTVQRWEKREGMPVHRHLHDKLGSVYAFRSELDAWAQSRKAPSSPAVAEVEAELPAPEPAKRSLLPWLLIAVAVAAIAAGLIWFSRLGRAPQNPIEDARFIRLTDFEGTEQAAAISRDGRFVAFLADRNGAIDVWVTQAGTSQFHNLTGGKIAELLNPDIRMIGFTPDGAQVTMWVREQRASGSPNIGVWTVSALGGEPTRYLEGVAEFDWSRDGKRLVYHTPAPGDPMFVRDERGRPDRPLFTGAAGTHTHYQLWSPDDEFIYFVHGALPDSLDLYRIRPSGGAPEKMTSHNSQVSYPAFVDPRTLLYLATDSDDGGPWLYSLDVKSRETRRVSTGVERYTSLAASADGRRLVATLANPRRTLWRVPISDGVAEEAAASRVTVPIVGGRAPRVGPGFLLYVSSRGSAESIWKLTGTNAVELWSLAGGKIVGGPAIAPDGRRIAFTVEEQGRNTLYLMNADGSGARAMPASLQPRGAPAWSPDGRSIAVASMTNGAAGLVRVSLPDETITSVVADFAASPVWSPDGNAILYSGHEIGTTFPIRAVALAAGGQPATKTTLDRGARRVVFMPGRNSLVVLRGDMIHKNFWLVDLDTGRERRLTNFGKDLVIADFDISPDGREIVFDREQDNSDIVLIER